MYSFFSKVVVIILLLLLILLWILGKGPMASNECCSSGCNNDGNKSNNGISVVPSENNASIDNNLLTAEVNTSIDTNATLDAKDSNSTSTSAACSDKISLAVSFGNASTAISADGKKMLDEVAKCLTDGAYEIAGHTDGAGKETMNQKLSEARAESTKDYLVLKGVDANKLIAKGYGESKPVATNHTKEGRAKNRHIEFIKQ